MIGEGGRAGGREGVCVCVQARARRGPAAMVAARQASAHDN